MEGRWRDSDFRCQFGSSDNESIERERYEERRIEGLVG